MKTFMLDIFIKRALADMKSNKFLNIIAIITLGLSILIVSAFLLFLININEVIDSCKKSVRIMAYLDPGFEEVQLEGIKQRIREMDGVSEIIFISKEEALKRLKEQMKRQSSLFENIDTNPLPDSFEVQIAPNFETDEKMEALAQKIEKLPSVQEVEYGRKWVNKFTRVVNIFKITAFVMALFFLLAAIFIMANTIRLLLYSKREEIQIMRLVGATDSFIKWPFYIEGLIMGGIGGIIGISMLFLVFIFISINVSQDLASDFVSIRFFSIKDSIWVISSSMFVGWLGCYLSLKQFLKA
ncbi:MAG: ABC transporter permease [Desulfobacterales bacterium]|nr:ABC transporter permease [Desulfobacterales bacterium]